MTVTLCVTLTHVETVLSSMKPVNNVRYSYPVNSHSLCLDYCMCICPLYITPCIIIPHRSGDFMRKLRIFSVNEVNQTRNQYFLLLSMKRGRGRENQRE